MLVVSNSAGTPQYDAGGIQVRAAKSEIPSPLHIWEPKIANTFFNTLRQAESISHYLQVPILRHETPKPGYSCIQGVRNYFASLPSAVEDNELVVIGDRIFTDVVMANRMKSRDSGRGPLAIWTSGVWAREAMCMRWIEKKLVEVVTKYTDGEEHHTTQFLKPRSLEKSREDATARRAFSPNADLFKGIWKHFVRRPS